MKDRGLILKRLEAYLIAREKYLKEDSYASYRRITYKIKELEWVLGLSYDPEPKRIENKKGEKNVKRTNNRKSKSGKPKSRDDS